jgi:hypothetical protein
MTTLRTFDPIISDTLLGVLLDWWPKNQEWQEKKSKKTTRNAKKNDRHALLAAGVPYPAAKITV